MGKWDCGLFLIQNQKKRIDRLELSPTRGTEIRDEQPSSVAVRSEIYRERSLNKVG